MITKTVPLNKLFKRSCANAEKKGPPETIPHECHGSLDEKTMITLHMNNNINCFPETVSRGVNLVGMISGWARA